MQPASRRYAHRRAHRVRRAARTVRVLRKVVALLDFEFAVLGPVEIDLSRLLVRGAAVLDQLPDLDIWLAKDTGEERPEEWRPYRLLTGLLDADSGYLAPLLR